MIVFLTLGGLNSSYGVGKLSWFYLSYGIDIEHWIYTDGRIRQIDQIPNYPSDEEIPKTLQTLKAGGRYDFNEKLGLYFELPFYYNRVESYQYDDLNGENTETREVFALGDSLLGVSLNVSKRISGTFFLKFPSAPLGVGRQKSRDKGSPWAGFGALQVGLNTSIRFKKHFVFLTGDMVLWDPFATSTNEGGVTWILPGDVSFFSQYVYEIKLLKNKNIFLKPWAYLSYSYYHWGGTQVYPYEHLRIGPGLSFSLWLKGGSEISLSTYWSLLSLERLGTYDYDPHTQNLSFGLYYGRYR